MKANKKTLETTVEATPEVKKAKKDKEYSFGALMKRWYSNVKDPFDSVLYGSKCTAYAIHQVPTLRRQTDDRKEKYEKMYDDLEDRMEKKSKMKEKLNMKFEQTKDKTIYKEIKVLEKDIGKLRDEKYGLRKKAEPWNGWSTLSCLGTVAATGGVYTVGALLAVGAAGPVGYGILGVPVATQFASHVRESLVKARRDLKKEYKDNKDDAALENKLKNEYKIGN